MSSKYNFKFRKILQHPEKETIISMLSGGRSINDVVKYLKNKYKRKPDKWLSEPTLQAFRKDYLEIDKDILQGMQMAQREESKKLEAIRMEDEIKSTTAYQDKVAEVINTKLDVGQKLLQIEKVVDSRIEYWYNTMSRGEELPEKADHEIRKYIEQQIIVLEKYKKLVEGAPDRRVDYNLNINVANDQIRIIKETIREVLVGIDPAIAVKFFDVLSQKMREKKYTDVSSLDKEESFAMVPMDSKDDDN